MSGDLGGSLGPPMQEDARLARNIEAGRQLAPGNLARQVSKADTTQSRPAASLDSVNSSSLGQFCPVDEESHSPISQRQGSGSASLSNSSSFVNVGLSLSPPESSASLNTVDAIAARTPDSSHGNAFSGFGPGSVPTGIAGGNIGRQVTKFEDLAGSGSLGGPMPIPVPVPVPVPPMPVDHGLGLPFTVHRQVSKDPDRSLGPRDPLPPGPAFGNVNVNVNVEPLTMTRQVSKATALDASPTAEDYRRPPAGRTPPAHVASSSAPYSASSAAGASGGDVGVRMPSLGRQYSKAGQLSELGSRDTHASTSTHASSLSSTQMQGLGPGLGHGFESSLGPGLGPGLAPGLGQAGLGPSGNAPSNPTTPLLTRQVSKAPDVPITDVHAAVPHLTDTTTAGTDISAQDAAAPVVFSPSHAAVGPTTDAFTPFFASLQQHQHSLPHGHTHTYPHGFPHTTQPGSPGQSLSRQDSMVEPTPPSSSSEAGKGRTVNVLMIGTGEYTTGYVHGSQSNSDKGAGVVLLTMADLQRRGKLAGDLLLAGVNGRKFAGIRSHLKRAISDVYAGMGEFVDKVQTFPADDVVDPQAYKLALRQLHPGDAVIIFTPDNTHFEICRDAVSLGLHVLVTKPLVQTLEHHLDLDALARQHGVLVCTEVHKRYDPMYVDARDKIRSQCGLPSHMVSYMSQPKHQLQTFKDWAGLSSDISYYLNSHHVDFHEWVAGADSRPVSVSAIAATGVASSLLKRPCEDTITLSVLWANRDGSTATGVYTASWIAPKGDVHSQQRFFYMGQTGEINIDQAHRGYSMAADDGAGYRSVNPLFMKYTPTDGEFSGQQGYGYRSLEGFIEAVLAIKAGYRTPLSFAHSQVAPIGDTFRSTAILEAGRQSLDGKCTIEILYNDSLGFSVMPIGLRRK